MRDDEDGRLCKPEDVEDVEDLVRAIGRLYEVGAVRRSARGQTPARERPSAESASCSCAAPWCHE